VTRTEAGMNRADEIAGRKSQRRARVLLAGGLASAALFVTGRGALLYGWTQPTFVGAVVTVPIAIAVYFVIVRRWSRSQ